MPRSRTQCLPLPDCRKSGHHELPHCPPTNPIQILSTHQCQGAPIEMKIAHLYRIRSAAECSPEAGRRAASRDPPSTVCNVSEHSPEESGFHLLYITQSIHPRGHESAFFFSTPNGKIDWTNLIRVPHDTVAVCRIQDGLKSPI